MTGADGRPQPQGFLAVSGTYCSVLSIFIPVSRQVRRIASNVGRARRQSMTKELVISYNRHETKVALLEDDQLAEIYYQRSNEYSLAGSIHKGRVTRVLPGMQSAFVDLGLERDTFLYVSDFLEDANEDIDRIPLGEEMVRKPRAESAPKAAFKLPEAEPGAAAAPPSLQTPREDADARDRRGRRSRRRRRGRGFPESKYAAENPPAPAGVAPADESEITLLPGESLAKYKSLDAVEEGGAEEPDFGQASHTFAAADTGELEPGESGPDDVEIEAPVAAEVAAVEEFSEEIPEVSDLAEARAEAIEEAIAQAEIEDEEENQTEEPEEEPVLETPSDAVEVLAALEGAADEAGTGEVAEAEAAAAALEEAVEATEATASEGDVEPARIPQSLTAQLRERDIHSRFQQHRGQRRMRRRGRGGIQGEQTSRGPSAESQPTVSAPEKPQTVSITDLLKEGQEILVQIAKEPMGQKGARITSHIALPGRYCVYMPTVDHVGVSRKIASDEERLRLKRILQTHRKGMSGGFIIRTAGEGKSEDDIAADMTFLYNLWLDLRAKAEKKSAPALIHHDLDIVQRILRDQLTESFKAIWVDDEDIYGSVLSFVQRFQPPLVGRVKLYTRDAPIFDAFGITQELEKALRPKVWLKSGGYIVINQTEALVAIDVNTGKFVGKSNRLEDTIVKTNTEAVKEIVRQIRLRDLGGIIVVDFIDMDERRNRQKVMQALEETMRMDRAPYKILQFNDFGLVAITRKRVKQSLERTLCAPCPYCEGAGYVKSVQTVIGEIVVEAHKIAKALEGKDVLLRVHPDVAKTLKSTSNSYLEELEGILGRPVLVKGDDAIHVEKFDLA
jgi:ribonuclease G